MPDLDVSDVLDSLEFVDTLTLERQLQVVGDDGLAVNTPSNSTFTGVVTSDRGKELARLAAGETVSGSILVHTRFRLTNGRPGDDPGQVLSADIVGWNGGRYTVMTIDDYSRYGDGFIVASCDLIPLTGS